MSPPSDDEPEISILRQFDPEEHTPLPTELPPETPSVEKDDARAAVQERLDRSELQRAHTRLTDIERRLHALEIDPTATKVDRMLRQWRLFRKYTVAWLTTDASPAVDVATLLRQWRRLRKFLAVWLRED